jgi:ABC-type antimicrobial peptide transport system permease subunit
MQKAYSLDKASLIKIAKGAGIALGGALLVYIAEVLPQVNFGAYTGIFVAIASILINAGKEYIKGQK